MASFSTVVDTGHQDVSVAAGGRPPLKLPKTLPTATGPVGPSGKWRCIEARGTRRIEAPAA
jgi:hypothetical protein